MDNDVEVSKDIGNAFVSSPEVKRNNWSKVIMVGLGVLLIVSLVVNGVQVSQFKSQDIERTRLITELANSKVQLPSNTEESEDLELAVNTVIDEYAGDKVEFSDDLSKWSTYEDMNGKYTIKIAPGWAATDGQQGLDSKKYHFLSLRYYLEQDIISGDKKINFPIRIGPIRDLYEKMCMPVAIPGDAYTQDSVFDISLTNKTIEEIVKEYEDYYLRQDLLGEEESIEEALNFSKFDLGDNIYGFTYEGDNSYRKWYISNGKTNIEIMYDYSSEGGVGDEMRVNDITKILKTLKFN